MKLIYLVQYYSPENGDQPYPIGIICRSLTSGDSSTKALYIFHHLLHETHRKAIDEGQYEPLKEAKETEFKNLSNIDDWNAKANIKINVYRYGTPVIIDYSGSFEAAVTDLFYSRVFREYNRIIHQTQDKHVLLEQLQKDDGTSIATLPSSVLVLYSTQTELAHHIATKYYNGVYFVFCSPYFNYYSSLHTGEFRTPPSSTPGELYRHFYTGADANDLGSKHIRDNRLGVLHGAGEKKRLGIIRDYQYKEITDVVNRALFNMFFPMLYIIPMDKVRNQIEKVPYEKGAHPFSSEYIIKDLPRNCFDFIKYDWR